MNSQSKNTTKNPGSPIIKKIKSPSTSSVTATSNITSSVHSNSLKKTTNESIKKTNSPTISSSTLKKNVSSPLNRTSTIISSSNFRRNSSLYTANYSTNVNIQELEEITNLNTQLNQWIYLNAMTTDAYESQKKEAEKQLYDGYKYITKQKEIYNNLNEEYFNKYNLIKVNRNLDIQEECISIIENQLNKFKQIYEDFLIALHSTASKMTTHGIITKDIDNLTKQFNECEKNLKILTEQKEKIKKVNKLSSLINSLNIILKEELEELNEFKELLNKLKKAETLNNSLQIQYVSLNNKK